ncbi:alpha/beta hydrolase [Bacillus sp. E(2018)]|uniref:alpha/beta fold hydrolase n=1 Tax=Bacillus sp. E(2018) TaxID=2502239 RepID=UPI0010F73C79|nr:alpha/beta hydrolase [Bacillus sp. E(2018)]
MILHTHTAGDGEPIVFIHSGGMTGLTEYEEQKDYFAENHFKVIRPDLRGHGKSQGTLEDYFNQCVVDLKDTLDSLNIGECHIAGVSIGGVAALMFAKKYPSRVKTLTFSGIFPIQPENWEDLCRQEAEHHKSLFNNPKIVGALNQMHENNDWRALLKSFNSNDFYPFHETGDLSGVKAPILCMVGEKEELEVEAALVYKRLHTNTHISVIPFAGHLIHRDQPELYARILFTFIQSYNM